MSNAEKPKIINVLSQAIGEAGTLFATDPGAAEKNATDILGAAPGQPHALALFVAGRRLAGDLAGARDRLEEFAKAEPNLASIRHELGLVLRDLGDRDGAIAALSKVVEMEPQHPTAWRALGDLLIEAGRVDAARKAYAAHFEIAAAQLRAIDPGASPALDQLPAVETTLEAWLSQHPTDVVALRLLGAVSMKLGHLDQAERQFSRAVELSPGFKRARFTLATILNRQTSWAAAVPHLDILLRDDPENVGYLNLLSEALVNTGQIERAIACFGLLLSKNPSAANWMYYGHVMRGIGRVEECIGAYRSAIAVQPDFGQAYWSLANLKTFQFTPSEMAAMHRFVEDGALDRRSRTQMHFALGKALEDAKEYERSFEHYRRANAVWRKDLPHDPDHITSLVRRSKAVFTADFFREHASMGSPAPDPIFVLGLPRSGSTLIEQILASHSSVEGAGELPVLGTVAKNVVDFERTLGETYPEILREKTPDEIRSAGEEYLDRTRIYRKLNLPHFVDKMPSNFHHIGLLLLILPNAKIIDARRHPLGAGLANFKQFYPEGQEFTFDLAELARYYRDYVELMAHFDEVLPGRIHRVSYEELVTDTEREIRRLLDYCGLPFEERCLRYYETDRNILTSSSEQVRRPVFTEGMTQWRNYEAWLGPMKAALGDVLTCYPVPPRFDGAKAPTTSPYAISWGSTGAITARFDPKA